MPEPLNRDRRYMPGLDGLRALAVLAVVFYHLGFPWASGGLLGVGVFFTLSGYLITDLLLDRVPSSGVQLGGFWLARARRLLPALFLMLAVVVIWVGVIGPAQAPGFGQAVVASVFYLSNWQLIFHHVSYFQSFDTPSPLNHLWSLGVEEQFYIVWPLLLLVGLRFLREAPGTPRLRPRLATATLLLAAGSAAEMTLLYRPSLDPSRVYYGTDTRAFELLVGAALAMVWPSARLRANIPRGARLVTDGMGVAGLAAIALLTWYTTTYSAFLYRGGFVLLSIATALVVASLVHPAGRLGPILGVGVLRWIGVRSYGIYLWHVPIILLTTPAGDHQVDARRAALQVGATISVAALSWRFVEQPIRHGALGRLGASARALGLRRRVIARPGLALMIGTMSLLTIVGAAFAGVSYGRNHRPDPPAHATSSRPISRAPTIVTRRGIPTAPTAISPAKQRAAAPSPARSSCRAVIHIGDSTSEGLTSPDYLPDPRLRIEAQYDRVGATTQHYEISGARSIVETYQGEPNAYTVAQAWKQDEYRGCWVLALGTNDTADVYAGSNVNRPARIKQMMAVIGNQPVLWITVKSLLTTGPYAEQNMQLWDDALLQACHQYPNMRVFDWAAVVKNKWFIDDGIHFNTPGYAARSRLIATGLAHAFPAAGHSSGCVVR
jgi:peptidoglycan/LPS O-acetylase OafA/YrhL